jgi:aminopeptidase N
VRRPIIDLAQQRPDSLLNVNAYQKGAWVLHQLRGMVGDSAFASSLRDYYGTYRHATAVSSDFARIASRASGRDLEWYFQQALTQPGYPQLDLRWRHRGSVLELDIRQTQPAAWGTYRIPGLVVRIDGTDHRVNVAGPRSRHTLRGVLRAPSRIEVDPEGWWLLTAVVNGAQRS